MNEPVYAGVIVDITHESLDRVFCYRVPEEWRKECVLGSVVEIPFGKGNRVREGYVVSFEKEPSYDPSRIKSILTVKKTGDETGLPLIRLAAWMREEYGSTMIQALKTVLPVRKRVKQTEKKILECIAAPEELKKAYAVSVKKKYKAKQRLLEALLSDREIPWDILVQKLNISAATVTSLEKEGLVSIRRETVFRNPVRRNEERDSKPEFRPQQKEVLEGLENLHRQGVPYVALLHGITGSGKTEVYMECMERTLEEGRQAIFLIPEIALTYQTVMRFYRRFGNRVSIIHSRLSEGERYDQFERARQGDIDIMIGPRSALFTPFPNLGLIVIDEEHEGAYQSENVPHYHARETAVKLGQICGADVILGSATPSMEAYSRALSGEYHLFTMKERAREGSVLPTVQIVDLREEMRAGNRSIFSRLLQEKMRDRLAKGEQTMLFLNRRGYASFVSCRSCGEAIKCPHCAVTLKYHYDGMLRCHYCGYEERQQKTCPSCGSPYLAPFGTGTQKVEQMLKDLFPSARVLRMDADTTKEKEGHEKILAAFANEEADILIGTQMIVKGHDFPRVTLVGALAADLSLNSPDFRGAERTFQLLTQAAGRAGRAGLAGDVVIQTYEPEHYSVAEAAAQNYESFYEKESVFRRMLHYPPFCTLLTAQISSAEEELAQKTAEELARLAVSLGEGLEVIGPADAPVSRVNDIFRKRVYVKGEKHERVLSCKDVWEDFLDRNKDRHVQVHFGVE